jgi:two-component system heavy metal sensor histidine kinase CusS
MLDRLEDSVNRLSKFSSDIAHELRTPLQTLRGESEIVLSKHRTIEQYQVNIQSNLEEYDKLAHIIESLLFIARAENTELELNKSEFDIKTEVQKIIAFYEALLEEKSVSLVFNGNGKLYADPLLFERAISNLVSNAIKYTEHGGQIKFHVVERKDQNVSISINNNGPVIAPEEIKNIFDRFFRASYAKAVDRDGLGLGLAIVKSIMNIHDGTIHVQSNTLTGTTFTLNFPPK